MNADRDLSWAVPGARVFLRGHSTIHITTIERTTATLIITQNGSKFPKKTLHLRHGGYSGEVISSITDESSVRMYREQTARNRAAKVADLALRFRGEPTEETASAVEAALESWRSAAALVK